MQEIRRFKPSTVSRRFSVAAGFYRTCVQDDVLEHSPAEHVRRPCRMMPAASGCAVRLSPERECTDCARHGDVLHYSDRDHEQQPQRRREPRPSRARRLHPRHRHGRRRAGRVTEVVTRFPPEPTATSTSATRVDRGAFGMQSSSAATATRFDDTNPVKEEQEYIDAIQGDIGWPASTGAMASTSRRTTSSSSTTGPRTW